MLMMNSCSVTLMEYRQVSSACLHRGRHYTFRVQRHKIQKLNNRPQCFKDYNTLMIMITIINKSAFIHKNNSMVTFN